MRFSFVLHRAHRFERLLLASLFLVCKWWPLCSKRFECGATKLQYCAIVCKWCTSTHMPARLCVSYVDNFQFSAMLGETMCQCVCVWCFYIYIVVVVVVVTMAVILNMSLSVVYVCKHKSDPKHTKNETLKKKKRKEADDKNEFRQYSL